MIVRLGPEVGVRLNRLVSFEVVGGEGRVSEDPLVKGPGHRTVNVTDALLRACIGRLEGDS